MSIHFDVLLLIYNELPQPIKTIGWGNLFHIRSFWHTKCKCVTNGIRYNVRLRIKKCMENSFLLSKKFSSIA